MSETRGPGKPPTVQGQQEKEMFERWGERYAEATELDAGEEQVKKAAIVSEILAWATVKFGIRKPWRKLDKVVEEPKDPSVPIFDAEGLSDEELKKMRSAMRLTIRGTMRRYVRKELTAAGVDPAAAAQKRRTEKLMKSILKSMKVRPRSVLAHEVYWSLFGNAEWREEFNAEYKLKREAARAAEKADPLFANTRRDWLVAKLEKESDEVKKVVQEAVKERNAEARKDFDVSLDPTATETPEECERFKRDMTGFAERFVDVLAQGAKGVVLMLVASPRVVDGVTEVALDKFEWAHLPPELTTQALSYSEVDVDAFEVMASRFKSYAEHVCSINFPDEGVTTEDNFADFVEWQGKVAVEDGHGLTGSQVPQSPAPLELTSAQEKARGGVSGVDEYDDWMLPEPAAAEPAPEASEAALVAPDHLGQKTSSPGSSRPSTPRSRANSLWDGDPLGAQQYAKEQGDVEAFDSVFREYSPTAALSTIPKDADLENMVKSLIGQLTQGGSSDSALFGSRGKRAKWSDFVVEAVQRYKERKWNVSHDALYSLLKAYLTFELSKPPCATVTCEGWTEFDLDGDDVVVRPVYLSNLPGPHYVATWPEIAEREDGVVLKEADWNLGASLCTQWRYLQPEARLHEGALSVAPDDSMDWGTAVLGGRKGVRLLLLGMLIWADGMLWVKDGTSKDDWNDLAADMTLVLEARTVQVDAAEAEAVAEEEGPSRAGPKRMEETSGVGGSNAGGDENTGRRKRSATRPDMKWMQRYDELTDMQKRQKPGKPVSGPKNAPGKRK